MGRSAYEALGIGPDHARSMARAFDEMDRRAMLHMAEVYDPDTPSHENGAYVARVQEIMGAWEGELRVHMDSIRADRADKRHR